MRTLFRRASRLCVASAAAALFAPQTAAAQGTVELAGHEQAVSSVAYRFDGALLATGGFDRRIKLWNVASQIEARTLAGHADMVLALAFAPDGKRLLSGGRDKLVKLWNLAAGEPVRAWEPLPSDANFLVLSPDGGKLLAAGADGVLRILELETGRILAETKAHDGAILALAVAPDGASVLTTGADKTLRAWSLPSLEAAGGAPLGEAPANRLIVARDGASAIVGDDSGGLRAFRLPIGATRGLGGHAADVVRLLRSGDHAVSLGSDHSVHVHSIADGAEIRAWTPPAPVLAMAVSPADPNLLATVSEDRAVRVWSLADGALLGERDELPDDPTSVAFLPDGTNVLVGENGGGVRVLPYPFVRQAAERAVDAHDAPLVALSRSADGKLLLTASQDKTLHLRDSTGGPIRAFALFAPVKYASLSPAGDRLAAVGADDVARLWSVDGTEIRVLPNTPGPVAFSADGKSLAVGGAENKVLLYPADAAGDPKPLAAHAGPIRALLFSPDAARVVSAGDDNLVKVADASTAAEIFSLSGHEAPVTSLAVSADGKRLVSGGQDKTAKIWDLEAGSLLATLPDAADAVLSVAVSPDGSAVLTGAADNQIRVYRGGVLKLSADCPAPAAVAFAGDSKSFLAACHDNRLRFFSEVEPRLLAAAGGPVRALAVSPDGAITYAASDDTLAHSWETQSGRPLRGLAHGGPALFLALTPDGTTVASADSGKLRVWNAETGAQTAAVDLPSPAKSLDLSPDGQKIAVATEAGLVQVFSRDGAVVDEFSIPNATQALFTPDGGAFVVGGPAKTLLVRPSLLLWSASQGAPVAALAPLPDGRFAAASADNRLVLRNATDGAEIKSIESPAPVAAAVSPDGARLALAGGDQRIRIYDAAGGELIDEYELAGAPFTSIAYRPDGQALVTTAADGALTLWSIRKDVPGVATARFSLPAPALSAVALADNRTAAAVGQDRIVRFFEPPPPESVDLVGHDGPVFGVAVDATGALVASASGDGAAILWNLAEAKAAHRLEGHDGQVYSVAFQPQGGLVATAAHDGWVILWERDGGKEVKRLEGSKSPLFQVAFSPDGKQLFTAGADKKLRIWDVETGGLVKSLEGHEDEIYGLAVRHDGKRLATSGYGGHVMLWNVDSGDAIYKQQFSLPAYGVAIRPDGAQLAVGSADGKAYLVDLPETAK